MIAGTELWSVIFDVLSGDDDVISLVDAIYDKVSKHPLASRQAYISRGPFYGVPGDADCIAGEETTAQIDIWSRRPSRAVTDAIVSAVRKALHGKQVVLPTGVCVSIWVTLWRVIDDPDPQTTHGIVQISAIVEESEDN